MRDSTWRMRRVNRLRSQAYCSHGPRRVSSQPSGNWKMVTTCENRTIRDIVRNELHFLNKRFIHHDDGIQSYAIMSTKFTDHSLQLSLVKRPRSIMSVQITLEYIDGSSSKRVEIFTATVLHPNAHPVTSEIVRCVSVADQQTGIARSRTSLGVHLGEERLRWIFRLVWKTTHWSFRVLFEQTLYCMDALQIWLLLLLLVWSANFVDIIAYITACLEVVE